MKYFPVLIAGIFLLCPKLSSQTEGFKEQQLKQSRVKSAYAEKEEKVKKLLGAKNIDITALEIFIRAFKQEEVVEIWAKNKQDSAFKLLTTYPFCSSSGTLGPKRKQGDFQTPEGFYFIDRFNPLSNFHLSLGINYPNGSDRILGNKSALGGDIFIKMSTEKIENYIKGYPNIKLKDFWTNLLPVYDYLKKNKNLPKISVSNNGSYLITQK
jgi:murein L,D-transpeptidase YafK